MALSKAWKDIQRWIKQSSLSRRWQFGNMDNTYLKIIWMQKHVGNITRKNLVSVMELEKGINSCLLEAFMRAVVFEVSIKEWVGTHSEQERYPRWKKVMESGKYKAFLEWCADQFGWGKAYVWGTGVGDQSEEGELRIRPWKVLCASLSWMEMKNHWMFLSKTVVWLRVCQ